MSYITPKHHVVLVLDELAPKVEWPGNAYAVAVEPPEVLVFRRPLVCDKQRLDFESGEAALPVVVLKECVVEVRLVGPRDGVMALSLPSGRSRPIYSMYLVDRKKVEPV